MNQVDLSNWSDRTAMDLGRIQFVRMVWECASVEMVKGFVDKPLDWTMTMKVPTSEGLAEND